MVLQWASEGGEKREKGREHRAVRQERPRPWERTVSLFKEPAESAEHSKHTDLY